MAMDLLSGGKISSQPLNPHQKGMGNMGRLIGLELLGFEMEDVLPFMYINGQQKRNHQQVAPVLEQPNPQTHHPQGINPALAAGYAMDGDSKDYLIAGALTGGFNQQHHTG